MRTGTANQIEIILIRHSYTRMNEEHRYIGRTDERLSERGISLAMTKKQQTDEPVFSGPMERCVETAENMFPESEIIEIPEWTEIDFGDFEGKNYQELNGNADYQRWIDSSGSIAFPNGESREAFIERSMQGLENMIEYAREKICLNITLILTIIFYFFIYFITYEKTFNLFIIIQKITSTSYIPSF